MLIFEEHKKEDWPNGAASTSTSIINFHRDNRKSSIKTWENFLERSRHIKIESRNQSSAIYNSQRLNKAEMLMNVCLYHFFFESFPFYCLYYSNSTMDLHKRKLLSWSALKWWKIELLESYNEVPQKEDIYFSLLW